MEELLHQHATLTELYMSGGDSSNWKLHLAESESIDEETCSNREDF